MIQVLLSGSLVLGFLLSAALLPACCNPLRRSGFECQVRMGNRSGKDINFVIIDADGQRNQFGYLGYSNHGEKGAAGCIFRFSRNFLIEWEEDGIKKTVAVDLMRYEPKKDKIKSIGFYYLGNSQWQIAAHDGIGVGAKEIQP